MRRFFVPPEGIRGDQVVFPPAESRHVAAALRLPPGAQVIVFDGRGQDHVVELTAVDARAVTGRIVESLRPRDPATHLTLVQGIPKGAKMDDIIRMGTELGIAVFLPVLTQRTVARPAPSRINRWRRIATAAAKQSGHPIVPRVEDPHLFPAVWPRLAGTLLLLPYEGERERSIGSVLATRRDATSVAICIGPEGGWTKGEVREVVAHGGHLVTLGPLTLRTETAGVVTAAMVLYELSLRPAKA